MFPAVFDHGNDATHVVLASSHDGAVWHYVPGPALLGTAPFGQWDGGCVFATPNLLELADGRFALPYTGYIFPHKYPRGQWRFAPGLAVWPKGRLVALEAAERGEFTTVGIIPPGRRLWVNALTDRAGMLQVEVAGVDGKPIAGRSFADSVAVSGDHHRAVVRWRSGDDLGTSAGQGISLRFRMLRARIFGLEFGDA